MEDRQLEPAQPIAEEHQHHSGKRGDGHPAAEEEHYFGWNQKAGSGAVAGVP